MSSKKIFRAISVVSMGTLIARLFGLAREIVTAGFFGTTGIYDAFLIAFMIPNFFRGLLAEGALNAAFIPVFSEYISSNDHKKSLDVFHVCFTASLLITFSLSIIAFLLSLLMVNIIAETSKWFWVWNLLKFTFPYLIFISLTALNMGVLNVYKSFFIPSISPVILDIVWISALFFVVPFLGSSLEEKIFGLCVGVIIGGAGQFCFTLIPVLTKGYKVRLNFNMRHPAIKKIGKLLAPVIIGMSVGPINLLVDYSMANTLYEGAVSGLWYSTRIYQLPLGIFAISISTAILPWLSENISSKNYNEFKNNLMFSLKLLMLLMLPFTFGIIIMRTEIITFLFSRGMFTKNSVQIVAGPLAFYSIGLAGYGGMAVLTRAFYSCRDTFTPVKVGLISILANFVLNFIFMKFLSHNGIALSTSLVGTVNFLLLAYLFHKKHLKIQFKQLMRFVLNIFVLSATMGLLLYGYRVVFKNYFPLPLLLFSAIIIAIGFYMFFLKVLILKGEGIHLEREK